jgi:hypothetical protein
MSYATTCMRPVHPVSADYALIWARTLVKETVSPKT